MTFGMDHHGFLMADDSLPHPMSVWKLGRLEHLLEPLKDGVLVVGNSRSVSSGRAGIVMAASMSHNPANRSCHILCQHLWTEESGIHA